MSDQIRVILVGCGFMGKMHASVYQLLPNATIVAFVDKNPEAAQTLSGGTAPTFSTLGDALTSVEANTVDICLPTYLHHSFTIEAARSGKHVLCEKPMALSVEEADEMAAVCKEEGVTLMIGHCIRFWPEYVYLKNLVDSGELGRLVSLNLTRYGAFPFWASENWQADETKAGGGVLDMHIHDTDFALFLKGAPSKLVSHGSVDHRGASHAFTTFRYDDGTVIHLEGGWNLPPNAPFKMAFRAIFERGLAIMDGGPLTVYPEGKDVYSPEFEKLSADGGGNISDLGGYFVEIKYFVDCLTSGATPSIVTPETSRQSLATTLEEIRQIKASN